MKKMDYRKKMALRDAIEALDVGLGSPLLSNVIDVLVNDAEWILEWVGGEWNPEDVFDDNRLGVWAEENGYTKASAE